MTCNSRPFPLSLCCFALCASSRPRWTSCRQLLSSGATAMQRPCIQHTESTCECQHSSFFWLLRLYFIQKWEIDISWIWNSLIGYWYEYNWELPFDSESLHACMWLGYKPLDSEIPLRLRANIPCPVCFVIHFGWVNIFQTDDLFVLSCLGRGEAPTHQAFRQVMTHSVVRLHNFRLSFPSLCVLERGTDISATLYNTTEHKPVTRSIFQFITILDRDQRLICTCSIQLSWNYSNVVSFIRGCCCFCCNVVL